MNDEASSGKGAGGALNRRGPSGIMISFAVLVFFGVLCLAMMRSFLSARPMDLTGRTEQLTEQLYSVLEKNAVGRDRVSSTLPPRLRKQEEAQWSYIEMDILVPEAFTVNGVEKLIRKEMDGIAVASFSRGHDRQISLFLGPYEFARLRLLDSTVADPTRSQNVARCEEIAGHVEQLLLDSGAAPSKIKWHSPIRRENSGAVWNTYKIEAPLPRSAAEKLAQSLIDRPILGSGVNVTYFEDRGNEIALSLSLENLECVNLIISTSGKTSNVLAARERPKAPPTVRVADVLSETPPSLEKPAPAKEVPKAEKRTGPMVAIIIDDGGDGGPTTDAVLALPTKFTLAILPNRPFSTQTAERAAKLGFETMLHMPMESDNPNVRFPGMIGIFMLYSKVQRLTDDALNQVPGVTGVNNHTGSRYTKNRDAMASFLEVLKKKGLFFIDSRTSPDSIGDALAAEMGIKTAARDVFLDNESDPRYIRKQFDELIRLSKINGSAIGICHFRSSSVKVLKEMLPVFEKEGIEIVPASKVVK